MSFHFSMFGAFPTGWVINPCVSKSHIVAMIEVDHSMALQDG